MNQKKTLLILCGVLVVALVAYFGVTTYIENKEQAALEEEALLEEANTVYITQLTEEEIVGITWNYGSELSFVLEDEIWVYEDDTSISIDQAYLETVLSTYCILIAERELVDGDEISSYGLEEPAYSVTLTDSAGTDTTYYIGNITDENYYLTINDKTDIYTVTSSPLTAISYGLTDIVEHDTFVSTTSDLIDTVTIFYESESSEEDADETDVVEIVYTADDEGVFDTIVSGLSVLAFTTCVDANASDNLEAYGLDEAQKITWNMVYGVEIEVEESTEESTEETTEEVTEESTEKTAVEVELYEVELYIGYYDSDYATYYVQVEGSDMVYSMAGDTIDMMLNQYTGTTDDSSEYSIDLSEYFSY